MEKSYWVQEYSLIRKDFVTASNFHGGVRGGQRIVTDYIEEAVEIYFDFIESQKGKGNARYRLVESWWEGRIYKSNVLLVNDVQ